MGDGAAAEFIAYLEIYESAPSIDLILSDPANAPIPDEPSALYAVSAGLAAKATPKNFGSVALYAQRLYRGHKGQRYGEFATLTVRDALRRNKMIGKSPDFVKYCLSEAGKHIAEAVTEHQ